MNKNKQTKFMEAITPVILALNARWNPPDAMIEHEGEMYHLACNNCDLNCSRHDKHDDDCITQLAKNLKEEWDRIQDSNKWDKHWSKEQGWDTPSSEERKQYMKDWAKYQAFFSHFLKKTSYDMMVPLDYSDPSNECAVCSCSIAAETLEDMKRCQPDCPNFLIAGALSELYKPN